MDERRNLSSKALAPLERERAFFLYRSALERGEAEVVDRVLQLAETDAMLESMILESHALDLAEDETHSQAAPGWSVAEVRDTLAFHLSDEILAGPATSTPSREENRQLASLEVVSREFVPPLLTFAEVAAHMETGFGVTPSSTAEGAMHSEFLPFTQQLRSVALPLPSQLDGHSLSRFFQNLGMAPSERFQAEFRKTALRLRQQP